MSTTQSDQAVGPSNASAAGPSTINTGSGQDAAANGSRSRPFLGNPGTKKGTCQEPGCGGSTFGNLREHVLHVHVGVVCHWSAQEGEKICGFVGANGTEAEVKEHLAQAHPAVKRGDGWEPGWPGLASVKSKASAERSACHAQHHKFWKWAEEEE
ncbi:hypothetical protein F5Y18DRAFT_434696 [Xylariaceae sp. FL1019]|nr:hypothetical protein F5Y18DRAFT_434696 [Xylariaceae sp. FL1019]